MEYGSSESTFFTYLSLSEKTFFLTRTVISLRRGGRGGVSAGERAAPPQTQEAEAFNQHELNLRDLL